MDIWKYYNITHKNHVMLNPMSKLKFEGLLSMLNLKQENIVLDIGSGKGEFLVRLAELYSISGIGVDMSPYFVKDAIERKKLRIPDSNIRFLEMDGADYKPDKDELFDLTICLGASFIYKGFYRTIEALKEMTKLGSLIVIGEPYWIKEPSQEYLKISELKKEDFNTHIKNIEAGEKAGLLCLYTLASNHDDWDHYETLQWWSAYDYIDAHPEDPDNNELLNNINNSKTGYLSYGRDTVGWAIYVFRYR
jgi:SAM-dependent methyltransferase